MDATLMLMSLMSVMSHGVIMTMVMVQLRMLLSDVGIIYLMMVSGIAH